MSTSPFAFEPPTESSTTSESPFSSIFTSFLPDTSSATLSTLSKLSLALLEHRIDSEVKKEIEQLRSDKNGVESRKESTEAEGEEEGEEEKFAHPTITSDSDAQAEMSANLDLQAEEDIEKNLGAAKDRIERGVRTTKSMELEIWLSQTILDAYEVSAGEEVGAARFVQDQLEDSLFEAGLDPVSVLQAPSSSA
ncbi:hypothetical protein JCM3765_002423 [Sporobolomyces pararoseus]